jgi:hypothetical protein
MMVKSSTRTPASGGDFFSALEWVGMRQASEFERVQLRDEGEYVSPARLACSRLSVPSDRYDAFTHSVDHRLISDHPVAAPERFANMRC